MNKPKFKQTEIGKIPEEWEVKELKIISHLITDGKHGDCKNEVNSGHYFISCKDINGGRINYSQSAIAKILSDLDSKIKLNQKMNKTLEAISHAIFKHWFIVLYL